MSPRWFRRKRFGFGWTPATWQGWLLMLVVAAVIVGVTFLRTH